MKILVSNDDGIYANGINALVKELVKEHEVYVIAPDAERSAAGHSLTLHTPLRVKEIDMDNGVKAAWAISGTPSDCVKLGLNIILDEQPDLVISGINHGPNLGSDILYSGTVSAALEGAIHGCPSIAVSLASDSGAYEDFVCPAIVVSSIVKKLGNVKIPKKSILNVNVPGLCWNHLAGYEITRLGTKMYTDTYEKRIDPRGKVYYWMAGEIITTKEEEGTDIQAIRNNKISITPVTFEMTHKSIMPELEDIFYS